MEPFRIHLVFIAAFAVSSGCRAITTDDSKPLLPYSENVETSPSPFFPSHNRDWLPDLAVLPYADIEGEKAVIHNIRNCTYRADDEFVVKHYDRTFELGQLEGVDFIMVPFKD